MSRTCPSSTYLLGVKCRDYYFASVPLFVHMYKTVPHLMTMFDKDMAKSIIRSYVPSRLDSTYIFTQVLHSMCFLLTSVCREHVFSPFDSVNQLNYDKKSLLRFDVLGSTGNLYHVRRAFRKWKGRSTHLICTCPHNSFSRRYRNCKHIQLILELFPWIDDPIGSFANTWKKQIQYRMIEKCKTLVYSKLLRETSNSLSSQSDCFICMESISEKDKSFSNCIHNCVFRIHTACFLEMCTALNRNNPKCLLCNHEFPNATQPLGHVDKYIRLYGV